MSEEHSPVTKESCNKSPSPKDDEIFVSIVTPTTIKELEREGTIGEIPTQTHGWNVLGHVRDAVSGI